MQVVGVPDARYGEELMACDRRPRGGAELDRDAVARVLPGQDRPLQGAALRASGDEFPMTVTGKVQKFKLREQAIEELGLAEVETA